MEMVKNLKPKKHLLNFYKTVEEMKKDYINMVEDSNLKEGIDYKFVEVDETKLNETQTCPNCDTENTQKYVNIYSVANEEPNKACINCIPQEDPFSL